MNKYLGIIFTATVLSSGPSLALDDPDDRVAASRAAVKEFSGMLQGQMQSAMQTGGPARAIEVCNTESPAVAAEVTDLTGMKVQRTSLRVRNPKNSPDAWETYVLRDFEKRRQMGEEIHRMEYSEIVTDENGKRVYRYMKAIPVAQGCTSCHGANIDPKISARLKELYPDDKAVGFNTGDIRGAFSIIQPM